MAKPAVFRARMKYAYPSLVNECGSQGYFVLHAQQKFRRRDNICSIAREEHKPEDTRAELRKVLTINGVLGDPPSTVTTSTVLLKSTASTVLVKSTALL